MVISWSLTVHKQSLLCFHSCLSVHGGGRVLVSVQGDLCPGGFSRPGGSLSSGSLSGGSLSGRSLSRVGVFVQGGLCPGRSLSMWSLPKGRGVSVQGGICLGRPPYGNVRMICILLECILVTNFFATEFAELSETFRKNSNATQERLTLVSKYNVS